ncbi:MAG TPA: hypothetical protein VN875_04160 [Candidatus Binatus sp.]|jgi:hypothetical protein|nr:hypothetical protein [Candidatus Binatus sp.]
MNTDGLKTSPEPNGAGDETKPDEDSHEQPPITYRSVRNVFLERFPDLWERIERKYAPHYNLKTQIPGTYPLFEEILKPRVIELLEFGADHDSLKHIFSFYEEMASSRDQEIVNLLWKSILEPLASDKKLSATAWKYMGEKTKTLTREIAILRGWEGNLPADAQA